MLDAAGTQKFFDAARVFAACSGAAALSNARIVAGALGLGAAGYVPKSAPKPVLIEAIATVLRGAVYVPSRLAAPIRKGQAERPVREDIASRVSALTRSEIRVLQIVRHGLLNKQIAHVLHIGETTVKAHATAILRKLKVVSRTQIVIETSHLDFDAILQNKAAAETQPGGGPRT
jgi:DNA-binding NarL/FixJ family response regulator